MHGSRNATWIGSFGLIASVTTLPNVATAAQPRHVTTHRVDSMSAHKSAERIPPRGLCFRDRPEPRCHVSVLYTAAAYFPVAATKVPVDFGGPAKTLTRHSDFSLGVLWNAGVHDALGLGVGAGWGMRSEETGYERNELHATYRRWLRNRVAVDVSPGFVRTEVQLPTFKYLTERRSGVTATVDLHYRHWAIATIRGDVMSGKDPSAKALYVGVKFDGYTALAASALAAAAYVANAFSTN